MPQLPVRQALTVDRLPVGRVVEVPAGGEDHTHARCGALLEKRDPDAIQEPQELGRAEREERREQIDGHVVVEEAVAGEAGNLGADGHLPDGRRPDHPQHVRLVPRHRSPPRGYPSAAGRPR
ncbi:MAG: hypothetical protein O3B31_03435 [Chloroflexi bacterium]|nr:hypothetical protein [Chloroflexota bacterium]MDA1002392.1 hypothetical protein [Chloroflexota bacterium]